MGWKWFPRRERLGVPPDYYGEGVRLANRGKFHEALTSFRLALRQRPEDSEIMQQMAAIYTQIGMPEEAVKFYEDAIKVQFDSPAAHYGLAFLLLNRGELEDARGHLEAFLAQPPAETEAGAHIEHARRTLEQLIIPRSAEQQTDETSEDEV